MNSPRMRRRDVRRGAWRTSLAALLPSVLIGFTPIGAVAGDLSAQQQLVEKAKLTFDRFLADRTTKTWYRKEARNVTAVYIVPQFLRGAFIVGAAGGSGVLLARDFVKGGWSPPAFYRMSTASIGAQAGADSSEVVLLVLTHAGLERFHGTGTFRLGLDAGMTVGSLSDGGVDGVDVISFAWSKGVFAGMSFDGVGITAAPGDNHAYYGRSVEPEQIFKGAVTNAQADELRAAVSRMIR